MGQATDFKTLQAQYKKLLNDAYQMSKVNQQESVRLYAQADQMRKALFAF
jgi:hypothetical protein